MFNQNKLTKLRQCHKFSNIELIAYDTEDNSEGAPENFLCAVFYDKDGMHKFKDREEAREFIFNKRKQTTLIFAHNLAYDINNIDYPEGTITLMPLKSRLIGGRWKYGRGQILRFMDTGNFFVGATIDSLGKNLNKPKIGCSCDVFDTNKYTGICNQCNCFDIRLIKHKHVEELPSELVENMMTYCGRDAEICYSVAKNLFELSKQLNTRFKGFTASSLALRIFRTNFLEEEWECRSMEINDYERLAYYGGRTEVYDYRPYPKVIHEDISSSYPTQMHNMIFPFPSEYMLATYTWEQAKKFEGISLVRITVPKMHIPPLPYRREDGKLVFPYGTWVAAYTHPELKMAEKYGVVVEKCYQSLIYHRTFRPFVKYIETFYNLKNTSSGIQRDFYKLMLNGLSGKLGEKTYRTMRGKLDTLDVCLCENKTPDTRSNYCNTCGKLCINGLIVTPENDDQWVNIIGAREKDSPHTFPVLIAYICAYGRIQLYEHRLKYQDALYTDTDSYMGLKAHNEYLGRGLGLWERNDMYNFRAYAPKFYTSQRTPNLCKCNNPISKEDGICSTCNNDIKKELKLKGVPKKHSVIWKCDICSDEYSSPFCTNCNVKLGIECKLYRFQRPLKLSEAIRRHMKPNTWSEISKRISLIDNKRIKHDDGTSEPTYVNDKREITTFRDMLKFYEMDTIGL